MFAILFMGRKWVLKSIITFRFYFRHHICVHAHRKRNNKEVIQIVNNSYLKLVGL